MLEHNVPASAERPSVAVNNPIDGLTDGSFVVHVARSDAEVAPQLRGDLLGQAGDLHLVNAPFVDTKRQHTVPVLRRHLRFGVAVARVSLLQEFGDLARRRG